MDPINQGEVSSTTYRCAYCGETNHTFVDPSQGTQQTYIEDCQVCCRPNQLHVSYDEWNKQYMIRAEQSQ
jgi:hypothetical protein